MNDIMNFHQYSADLSAGGQPTVNQIKQIKEAGFDRIINLSPTTTPNYVDTEANLTEQLGMSYVHFPVDCSNLQDHHFDTFRHIMNSSKEHKTFVHCAGNIKSSNLIHMYQVVEEDRDEKESHQELLQMQNPEDKWYGYFQKFGMEGVR